jgi:ABC-type multidrug transport system fused ATPase/permease subunit
MLRRLDSAYRSPVFSVICECAANASCLRSLNAAHRYEKQLERYLDDSLRVTLSVSVASQVSSILDTKVLFAYCEIQWLGMRLQLLGALIATSLSLSAVLSSAYGFSPVSSGLFGLSLSYSFSIVNNLNGLVSSSTETEQEMVSVERIQEYVALQDEYEGDDGDGSTTDFISNSFRYSLSDDGMNNPLAKTVAGKQTRRYHELAANGNRIQDFEPGLGFRFKLGGAVELTNVSMRYAPHLPLALRNISLQIPAGSKVAVVGRTGSGKSSLLRL